MITPYCLATLWRCRPLNAFHNLKYRPSLRKSQQYAASPAIYNWVLTSMQDCSTLCATSCYGPAGSLAAAPLGGPCFDADAHAAAANRHAESECNADRDRASGWGHAGVGEGRKHPWGNSSPDGTLANYGENEDDTFLDKTDKSWKSRGERGNSI